MPSWMKAMGSRIGPDSECFGAAQRARVPELLRGLLWGMPPEPSCRIKKVNPVNPNIRNPQIGGCPFGFPLESPQKDTLEKQAHPKEC